MCSFEFHSLRTLTRPGLLLLSLGYTAVAGLAAESETLLYQTDFSDFPVGDGKLVGTDGWQSTHPDELVHGIVDDFFGDGNRSGAVGFLIPESDDDILTVFRPINHDPLANATPIIEFSASIAMFDSEETEFYDSFHISVFNTNDDHLAGVVFDNTEENLGIWRADGLDFFDTGVTFEYAKLYALSIRIDYEANTWTATLDDTSLFTDAPFSSSDSERDLGDFSAEWEISDVANPGDNWMLFDDWTVKAVALEDSGNPSGQPLVVTRMTRRPSGNIVLRWAAEAGTQYQVETSSNFNDWNSNLPNSLVTTGSSETEGSFVDRTAKSAPLRYYRVRKM